MNETNEITSSGTIASSGTNAPEPKNNPPKRNCRHCHGRGYSGIDSKTKERIPCSCTWPDDVKRAWNYQQELARRFARK